MEEKVRRTGEHERSHEWQGMLVWGGVYDAGPCRNYRFAIDEHVDRFFNSAGLIRCRCRAQRARAEALLQDLVNKMDTGDLFIYFQVTRVPLSEPMNFRRMYQPISRLC